MRSLFKTYKITDNHLSRYAPHILAFSVFLLHIPYYSLLPFAGIFFNSYSLARILTFLLFTYLSTSWIYNKTRKELNKNLLPIILLLLLFTNSLSLFAAFNLPVFLSNFEDIIFAVLLFFNFAILLKNKPSHTIQFVVVAIIFSTTINTLDEILLLTSPQFYTNLAKIILPSSQIDFLESALFRGRLLSLNRYNEVFIPLFIHLINTPQTNKYVKKLLAVVIFFIVITAVFSGWRIRLITAVLGLISGVWITWGRKVTKKQIIVALILGVQFLAILLISDSTMRNYVGYSTIGRTLFEDQADIDALTVRLSFYKKAVDLFNSSPLIGVGIGHFRFIGEQPYRQYFSLFAENEKEAELLGYGPHNIFLRYLAETGILGFTAILIFTLYCIKEDIIIIKNIRQSRFCVSYILGFWFLFSFALLHPQFGFQFYGLLFMFRALIDSLK